MYQLSVIYYSVKLCWKYVQIIKNKLSFLRIGEEKINGLLGGKFIVPRWFISHRAPVT